MDPYEFLKIVRNLDGSITRTCEFSKTMATTEPHPTFQVTTQDVPLNPSRQTWLRIFRPHEKHSMNRLILYFHGGGFIFFSAASTVNHDFCSHMSLSLHALVVSLEYRLAPEHRLPAAYEDALDALTYLSTSHLDLSNCYLMGSSAGANVAYNVAIRIKRTGPLILRGIILHQPFFGGRDRTESEMRMVDDCVLPLSAADLMWDLSLPEGADRDHEYSKPRAEEFRRFSGLKVVVVSGRLDPLFDRQIEVGRGLETEGVDVEWVIGEMDCHGDHLFDFHKAKALFGIISKIIR